jgi:hypothetical protein
MIVFDPVGRLTGSVSSAEQDSRASLDIIKVAL